MTTQTYPMVSTVIVSFNTRTTTLQCLRALEHDIDGMTAETFVVDNRSGDGSVDAIRGEFPRARLIVNDRNSGFGAANNQAMREARGEFLLLLNSDAFLHPGAVRTLVDFLRRHPRAGAVGPRLLNADGSLQVSCFRFPSPTRAWIENLGLARLFPRHPLVGDYARWPHDHERNVEFVSGACILVRRAVWEQVGGFDERFFLYAEEADWQRRIHDAGWEIGFAPAANVTHLGGTSGASEPAKINRHFFESLDRYELKHHGLFGLVALRCAMVVGCFVRAGAWALAALLPRHRRLAWPRLRLHCWLLFRQTCCWR